MPFAESTLEINQICRLLQCVREKDKEQIQKLVDSGVPHLINYNEPSEGDTALNIAAVANDDDMIEFLLDLGAHPDVVDIKGRAPIMRAAEYGHVQCMEKLALKKANMKLCDLEGKGVLFYCINQTQRHKKCMDIALKYGAEVNNKSKTGQPVFNFACATSNENEDMCLMLLKKGADPNSVDEKTGRSALMQACQSGSVKVVRAILGAGAEVNELDKRRNHAAHDAAGGGHFECLVALASYGADFDQQNKSGNTPVHIGALKGQGRCCKFLGQRGCNAKIKNVDGQTAKILGKESGVKGVVKDITAAEKFYNKLSKPDAKTPAWKINLYDWTLTREEELVEVCKKYDVDNSGAIPREDFVDLLTSMGAPLPNIENNDFKSLMNSFDKDRKNVVDVKDFLSGKKLVEKAYLMAAFEGKKKKKKKGGKGKKGKLKIVMPICMQEPTDRQPHGAPPTMWVVRHQHFTDTGRFDRDHPPEHPLQDDSAWYLTPPEKTYISITEAAKYGDFETLKRCIERGVSIDTRDKYYKTPLMIAAHIGNLEMVQFLVENGASLNTEDNFKWTPLHHACNSGQLCVVQYLVEKGAEMNSASMSGGTAFNRAIETSHPELVKYLIEKGVKIQIENKKGANPVDLAYAWADPRVILPVEAKFESLPAQNDKKKGGKGGKGGKGSPKGKRPGSGPSATTGKDAMADDDIDEGPRQRKGSILRAASALAGGIDEQEDITYRPKVLWPPILSTKELISKRIHRREQFGWEVDFDDFEMPFNNNVTLRVQAMGGAEED